MGNTHPTYGDPPRRELGFGALYAQAAYDERYIDPKTGAERTRHHAAVWVGSVSVIGPDGKRQRRKVTAPTEAQARKRLREIREQKATGDLPTGSRKTLRALRDEWLATKANKQHGTYYNCEQFSRLYVVPELGTMTLKQLDNGRDARARLQVWVNGLAKRVSPRTVKHARDILRGILRYGIDAGYLTHDATRKLELPPVPMGYAYSLLDSESYAKLQEAANGHPLGAAYVLMFQHALRSAEVLALCEDDFDFSARTLTLRHSLEFLEDERRFNLKTIKNDLVETVPLTDAEIGLVKARLTQQKKERLKAGARWKGNQWGLVFTTETGAPFHHSGFYEPFVAILRHIGWKGRTRPYELRHTAVTLVEEKHGMKAAQIFARHKQFSTTANFYVHVSQARKREIADTLGALLITGS